MSLPSASVMYTAAGRASIASRVRPLTSPKLLGRVLTFDAGLIVGCAPNGLSVELHRLRRLLQTEACRYYSRGGGAKTAFSCKIYPRRYIPVSGETSVLGGQSAPLAVLASLSPALAQHLLDQLSLRRRADRRRLREGQLAQTFGEAGGPRCADDQVSGIDISAIGARASLLSGVLDRMR